MLHAVDDHEAGIRLHARHPVAEPTPSLKRAVADQAKNEFPDLGATGHVWSLADEGENLGSVNQNKGCYKAQAAQLSSALCDDLHGWDGGRMAGKLKKEEICVCI